jgi:hypothetical protein
MVVSSFSVEILNSIRVLWIILLPMGVICVVPIYIKEIGAGFGYKV